jgi:hypothetical protein
MKKSIKLGVVLIALTLFVGAFMALSATSTRSLQGSPTSGLTKGLPPDSGLIFNRKLASTSHAWGNDLVPVAAGFVAIDAPLNFTCPPGTCTASAEENVQIQGSTSGNRWAICFTVDGNFSAQPSCPFQGLVSSDGATYITGSFAQNTSGITAGHHSLQTFVYTDLGANLSIYDLTYRLYRP